MILTKSCKNKVIQNADKINTKDGHEIHFEVKGDAHLLLMPFYQELEPEENRAAVRQFRLNQEKKENRKRAKECSRRNKELLKEMGNEGEEIVETSSSSDTEDELLK